MNRILAILGLSILVIIGLFSLCIVQVYAENLTSIIYTPKDKPLGVAYGDWIIKFWEWWGNVPKSISPAEKEYQCFLHDAGNAIFLVDPLKVGTKSYSCNIPSGKPIFFPLVAAEYDTGETTNKGLSGPQLMQKARDDDNSFGLLSFNLVIDGKKIDDEFLKSLRAESTFWNLTMLEGNHYGEPPSEDTPYLAAAEGYYVFLKPLEPGPHEISYKATSPKEEGTASSGGITYKLIVNSSAT